jgi:3'-phosphoadenosine 5'-phosphosulfate sulfotransferase (PAPS reductase)/FAD synthetase
MTRQRMFLDIDCVEAARQRIRHVYDTFDTVCVQFSGGKDSTAVLYLAKEVHEERGLGPVKVIFRDEEMVSPLVLDYVNKVRNYDWVDMEWYCLPYSSEVWVLGVREPVVMWNANREREGRRVRPIPSWAITAEHFGLTADEGLPERIDYYTMQGKTGSVAFITGVRANESMVRYRSLVQKLHENYIVSPYKMKKSIPLKFAKVIYDWQTDDVLKFITEEHGADYCEYYDLAALTGSNTRVGIPLHSVAIRRIGDVVATEPDFYDRLWEIWPDIDAQRRWWPDFDIEKLISRYADEGFEGAKECIRENILGDELQRRAKAYVSDFRKKHILDPYSYPINWMIRNLLLNEIAVTSAAPVGPKTRAHTIRQKAAEQELENNAN